MKPRRAGCRHSTTASFGLTDSALRADCGTDPVVFPCSSTQRDANCPRQERDVAVDLRRAALEHDEVPGIERQKCVGTRTILFAGVNTDQCVMCTLTDANFLGYGCVLLDDCCATTSPAFCTEATLWNVRKCFGFVADSGQVLAALPP